jgi:hypothetical protein
VPLKPMRSNLGPSNPIRRRTPFLRNRLAGFPGDSTGGSNRWCQRAISPLHEPHVAKRCKATYVTNLWTAPAESSECRDALGRQRAASTTSPGLSSPPRLPALPAPRRMVALALTTPLTLWPLHLSLLSAQSRHQRQPASVSELRHSRRVGFNAGERGGEGGARLK